MRVIVVCSQYPPTKSGYARVAGNLVQEFRREGHTVVPLTEGHGCGRVGPVATLNSEGRRILGEGADIVQVIGPSPVFTEQVVWYARRVGIPTVYQFNAFAGLGTYYLGYLATLVDSLYHRSVYRLAIHNIKGAVFNTLDFAEGFGLGSIQSAIIPFGVNDPCTGATVRGDSSSSRDPGPLRLLFVGQLRRYKGIDNLVTAAGLAKRSGKEFRLTIVGSGPLRAQLETHVDEWEIRPWVVFKDTLDDEGLHHEYLSNDVLVLPSLLGESFGLVLVEARLHGLDLIASDLLGVRELVRDLKGTLVPSGDVQALTNAIIAAHPRDIPTRTVDMDVAARYSWQAVARQYLQFYGKVLNAYPSGGTRR